MTEPISYASTRNAGRRFSLKEALLMGLAPDGGLFLPDRIPKLDLDELKGLSFPDLSTRVLSQWMGQEVPEGDLADMTRAAFNFDVPLIQDAGGEGNHVLELFHGPTLSFKDFGARLMGRLTGHFLSGSSETITVLVATSGDTGSAVADGFSGIPGVQVVLLYPKGSVSDVQERQLARKRENVTTFRVNSTFDDCQHLVKSAFSEPQLSHLRLTSANSINIGRLLPQMLYYIYSWLELDDEHTAFCVPSGNLGNLTAGILAYRAGLPVQHFLAAHNDNNFLVRYLKSGDSRPGPSRKTMSNAMDVGSPSNFERLTSLLDGASLPRLIEGISVDDQSTADRIAATASSTGYLPDPHTAVALEAVHGSTRRKEDGPWIVLATAHPAKFGEAIKKATGKDPAIPNQLQQDLDKPLHVNDMEASMEELVHRLLELNPHGSGPAE